MKSQLLYIILFLIEKTELLPNCDDKVFFHLAPYINTLINTFIFTTSITYISILLIL